MTRYDREKAVCLLLLSSLIPGLGDLRNCRAADTIDLSGDALPTWQINEKFKKENFTFARVKYSVDEKIYGLGHTATRWAIDYPDADANFIWRLHQVTSIAVNPESKVVEITDQELFDYPFLYIVEPGRLRFTEEELPVLRKYLEGGGFLMFDDFWGGREWTNFNSEMKRLFPEREIVELQADHPIFHCVFDLKERPQVPHADIGTASQWTGVTMRRADMKEPHYRAILDDKKRIMILICHNTDLGDGWEKEGENEFYFREFSEKKAYPLGINIIFYAMTH